MVDWPIVTVLTPPYLGEKRTFKGTTIRDTLVDVLADADHPVYGGQRITARVDQLTALASESEAVSTRESA